VDIKDLKKAKLRPGMTAQARIIVEKVRGAVSVPLECVFEKDDRQIVYLRVGATGRGVHEPRAMPAGFTKPAPNVGFVRVEVELGPRNDDRAVIAKGLKGGEEVALRDVGAGGGK
jgi:multidrug efflux pump subunit AcrA (membrane-fusion protein)